MASKLLPLNAVSSVTLAASQLAPGREASDMPIVLHRVLDLESPPIYPAAIYPRDLQDPLPTRPPSTLPPPGDLVVDAHLGDKISSGRVGKVYDIHFLPAQSHLNDFHIPPLVAKVANTGMSSDMQREANFYYEMECLQGSAVPRCYGFFQTKSMEHSSEPMSVLILEKLGGGLPFGKGLDAMGNAQEDLSGIGKDLAELGILHNDIRWHNILYAPDFDNIPGCLPSLPSPSTGRTYSLRMIDFDRSMRIDFRKEGISNIHDSYLDVFFVNIPYGFHIQHGVSD